MNPTNCISVLAEHNIQAKENINIRCPLGTHEDKNPSFNISNNLFHCHSCGVGGDYIKLYSLMNNIENGEAFKKLSDDFISPMQNTIAKPVLKSPEKNNEMLDIFKKIKKNPLPDKTLEYLCSRGIDYSKIKKFIAFDENNIFIPQKNQHAEIVGIQSRSILEKKFRIQKGGKSGIFWKNDSISGKSLFVVEGMFDFLSIRQETSDVLGFVSASSFIDVSRIVEQYDTVYWLGDTDKAGENLKEKFIEQFKHKKILCTPKREKDINDLVSLDLVEIIPELKKMCTVSIGMKKFPKSTSKDTYTWGGDFIDSQILTPKKGDLVILCGDENAGKSAFGNFIARRNHEMYKHNVCYFSLESTREEVLDNIAFNYAQCTHLEWRDNTYKNKPSYIYKRKELEKIDVNIIGRNVDRAITIQDFFDTIKEQESIDLLFIDNLTAFNTGDSEGSIKDVIQKLVWLAKEINIPIVLVHHYRKRSPSETQKFRDLHALSGSRVVKDLSPLIIQIGRNRDPDSDEEMAEFYIKEGKVRKGGGTSNELDVFYERGDFVKHFTQNL